MRRLSVALGTTALFSGLFGAAALVAAPPASAVTCTPGIGINISPSEFNGRLGDAVTYTVGVFVNATECPVSDGTVTLTTPDTTGHTLSTTLSLDTDDSTTLGPVAYTISASDFGNNGAPAGFVRALASVSATATLPTEHTQSVSASTNVDIFVDQPSTSLTDTASPASGTAPLAVTFTYKETNTGNDAINSVSVSTTHCGTLTTPASSSDGDTTLLNPGATWTYTCSTTFQGSGVFTDSPTATGTDNVDDGPTPTEHASATVTANPPTSPASSVTTTTTTTTTPVAIKAATSIPTGEPWAGGNVLTVAGVGLGGGLIAVGELMRRRRRRAA